MNLRGALVIGAGDMGARHARAWNAAGVRVLAVVDPELERARAAAEPFGGAWLSTPEEGFALDGVDVVSICTPTALHAGLAVRALEAGKHVLCEKPAALLLADADRMGRAADLSGRQLRIGLMRRFQPAYDRLAEAVEGVGAPLYAQVDIAAGVRPKRLMHDADVNGGPVIDMCCHVFEQWETLFGASPLSVRAYGAVLAAGKPELAGIARLAIDTAAITLRYPDGVGQIRVSWGLPAGTPVVEQHSYVGPEGRVSVAWPDRIHHSSGSSATAWEAPESDPWESEVGAFAAQLRGEVVAVPPADIDVGKRALRVSLAALRSIAEDAEIDLREPVDDATGRSGPGKRTS